MAFPNLKIFRSTGSFRLSRLGIISLAPLLPPPVRQMGPMIWMNLHHVCMLMSNKHTVDCETAAFPGIARELPCSLRLKKALTCSQGACLFRRSCSTPILSVAVIHFNYHNGTSNNNFFPRRLVGVSPSSPARR